MTAIEPDADVENPLTEVQQNIAEHLATLSQAVEAPEGVNIVEPFAADDVDFTSEMWRQRLISVEGWLNLEADLDKSNPAAFVESLSAALRLPRDAADDEPPLALLEKLNDSLSFAVHAQSLFVEESQAEGASARSATDAWKTRIAEESEAGIGQSFEPVNAVAETWKLKDFFDFANADQLDLAPSYQRSDVWAMSARQALIESVLRGIPLPSIILMDEEATQSTGVYEVVDGRQRLTSVLRWIGAHPVALAKVRAVHEQYPGHDLEKLFSSDYPRFKRAWNKLGIDATKISAKVEETYHFPFKLRSDAPALRGQLAPLQNKYYCQVKSVQVQMAGGNELVSRLFTGMSDYKVPVIKYKKASPQQIHEVFHLYNKQGMHLNAEEIRNALFHNLEVARAVLVASGDSPPRSDRNSIAPSLAAVGDEIQTLQDSLEAYDIATGRYHRSKIVSWIMATLLHPPGSAESKNVNYPSTASHINLFFGAVQGDRRSPFRDSSVVADIFVLLAAAAEVHAEVDETVWTSEFKAGPKWLDLELVGSLVGVAAAGAVLADELRERMDACSEELSRATRGWARPEKTQTKNQWQFVAAVAKGTVTLLGVDPAQAHEAVLERFGVSGLRVLFSLADEGVSELGHGEF